MKFKYTLIILFSSLFALGQSNNFTFQEIDLVTPPNGKPVFKTSQFTVYDEVKTIDNIPVFNQLHKIIITNDGQDFLVKQANFIGKHQPQPFPEKKFDFVIENLQNPPEKYMLNKVYYLKEELLIPAIQLNYANNSTHHELIIFDFNGEILEKDDLLHSNTTKKDSTTNVWVFNPDPLTSSNTNYGDSTLDDNDQSNQFLDNQLQLATTMLSFSDSLNAFLPENKYLSIQEFSSPDLPPNPYPNPIPKYNRNQPQFEELNIAYHIQNFRNHLTNLGLDSLVNYQIAIDAHGFNGADQSSFNELFNPPRLTFGTGGVDDAEDADVIIHEYAHAIYYDINPNAQLGAERAAIEEAFGDYFAASYSKSINPFNWHRVFNWDGHNEFWSGRVVNTSKTYPTGIKNNIYLDAEIFSSALMEVWDILGRNTTDRLLIESAALHLNNMSMQDAAYLFIYVNDISNGGAYREDICQIFFNRGLILNCPSVGLTSHVTSTSENTAWITENIIWFSNPVAENKTYQIFNLQGQIVQEGKIPKGNNSISINQNWKGLGLLKVGNETYKLLNFP